MCKSSKWFIQKIEKKYTFNGSKLIIHELSWKHIISSWLKKSWYFFLFLLFFIGLELLIFGIDSYDEKQVTLKKYKFKDATLSVDKGR